MFASNTTLCPNMRDYTMCLSPTQAGVSTSNATASRLSAAVEDTATAQAAETTWGGSCHGLLDLGAAGKNYAYLCN